MKKKLTGRKKTAFPAWRLFLAGFLAGVLLPNILQKIEWQQQTISSIYLLSAFAGRDVSGTEYFLEVLRTRGSVFLIIFFCGISVFGVPMAVIWMVVTGIKTGALLTMSILQFGLTGGAVGAGLLFPQYLLYLPVMACFLPAVYRQSAELWKNRGLLPEKLGKYCIAGVLAGGVYMLGILLETYANPWIVEMLTEKLKFL